MRKSRLTQEQIIGVLKEHQAGASAPDLCRKHGIRAATFYTWRSKYVLTWAPFPLRSEVESAVAATPIVTVFLGSVERRFSVPAMVRRAVARSLGQPWPEAIAGGDAQRG